MQNARMGTRATVVSGPFEMPAPALRALTPFGTATLVGGAPLDMDAGTVWINGWAVLADRFEDGGVKRVDQGRMRGPAVLDDFLEYKHVAFVPTAPGQGA